MKDNDCCFSSGNNWFRYRTGAIIIENDCVLFAGDKNSGYLYTIGGGVHYGETAENCVKREVMEETGVEYEIDRLAVICENFFKGHGGCIDNMDCHTLELYFLMKSKGTQKLNPNFGAHGTPHEALHWVNIAELKNTCIKPAFLKERMIEFIESKNIIHVVNEADRQK